jgi:hypothetical protein
MKTKILALAVSAALLGGCSSVGSLNPFGNSGVGNVNQPADNTTAVKDQTVRTEFTGNGIQVEYTLLGELKAIEVVGVADAWKGNFDVLAEADAKEKLVKFIYGEDVDSDRRVQIIAKAIDRATDNAVNKINSDLDTITQTVDTELLAEIDQEQNNSTGSQAAANDNTSRRIAAKVETTVSTAITTITSGGRLTGIRKISDEVRDNGKIYAATYRWTRKDQAAAQELRGIMSGK